MTRNYTLILSALFFLSINLTAQSSQVIISETASYHIANTFLNRKQNDIGNNFRLANKNAHSLTFSNKIVAYVYDLTPSGFLVISPYNTSNPIIGYSFENDFDIENKDENAAFAIITDISEADRLSPNINKPNSNEKNLTLEIGPFVESAYGQVNCYDIDVHPIYPTNYYTPNHYAPGCVAISMVTMMQYYEWPIKGVGFHQHIDSYGNSTGTYVANFEDTTYDWDNILPLYKFAASTEEQQEAIGLLTYQAAIALNMDFENTGSTSNVNRIPNAGREYFSYISSYKGFNATNFWSSLDSNIVHYMPVTFAVNAPNGAGHSCVANGLKMEADSTLFYHLNMGWWGSANGWYRIRHDFSAGGYTSIEGGVFDFLPKPFMYNPEKLEEGNWYKLKWDISAKVNVEEYELRRKINTGLWHTLETNGLDDSLLVEVGLYDDYFFEIRAKIDGKWYNNGWSNQVKADDIYVANENIAEEEFMVYPNPFSDNIKINIPDKYLANGKKIELYRIDGKLVLAEKISSETSDYNIPSRHLNAGVYLMKIYFDDKILISKLVKN